jgi:hypothetical protein
VSSWLSSTRGGVLLPWPICGEGDVLSMYQVVGEVAEMLREAADVLRRVLSLSRFFSRLLVVGTLLAEVDELRGNIFCAEVMGDDFCIELLHTVKQMRTSVTRTR